LIQRKKKLRIAPNISPYQAIYQIENKPLIFCLKLRTEGLVITAGVSEVGFGGGVVGEVVVGAVVGVEAETEEVVVISEFLPLFVFFLSLVTNPGCCSTSVVRGGADVDLRPTVGDSYENSLVALFLMGVLIVLLLLSSVIVSPLLVIELRLLSVVMTF